jgi:hypothetical protein
LEEKIAMAETNVEIQQRTIVVETTKTVSVLSVRYDPAEVDKILLNYALANELPRLGLESHEQLETKVEAHVDYYNEEHEGFTVEIVFEGQ